MNVLFVGGPLQGGFNLNVPPLSVVKITESITNTIHEYHKIPDHPHDFVNGYEARFEWRSSYKWR